jgi:hypothetical protein
VTWPRPPCLRVSSPNTATVAEQSSTKTLQPHPDAVVAGVATSDWAKKLRTAAPTDASGRHEGELCSGSRSS